MPGAVGVLLLLVLLTWLLLRATDTNAPAQAATLQAFDDFAIAEASLDRDLLQARAGLLRDYDRTRQRREGDGGRGRPASFPRPGRGPRRGAGRTPGRDGRAAGGADGALQEQQRALAEFSVLCRAAEHKPGIRRPGCTARTRNRRIGGGDPLSDARYITGRRQGAAGTDRPVCGASAHGRTGRRGSAGAARACPPAA